MGGITTSARFAAAGLMTTALILGACDRGSTQADLRKPAAKEWPMVEGNWGSTRYSQLKQINVTTAKSLGGAWVRKWDNATSRAVPVVANGLMYVTAGSEVMALNPKTGETVWATKTAVPPTGLYKGVAQGEGRVFVGLSDSAIVAFDAKTGQQLWSTKIGDENANLSASQGQSATGQFISSAPAYASGLVISGLANGDYRIRGRVTALDAKTGQKVWNFYTIPGPGEIGGDTWPATDEYLRGGGGVWVTPTIDPDLGLVYFGVGNPVPQWGGELREGDNLFTGSIVALDLKTGKHRWHFQLVHHDIWEQDITNPMILYEAPFEGKARKVLGLMRTDGYFFQLDRETGKPLVPVEERPVPQNARVKTAATQPFPVGVEPIGPTCTPRSLIPENFKSLCLYEPVDYDMLNGMYLVNTVRAARLAYSPDTNYVYVASSPWPIYLRRHESPRFFSASALRGIPGVKIQSELIAFDTRSNKVAWRKPKSYDIRNGSGFLATAGGVVFHGEPDGKFEVYDAKTGDLLKDFQTSSNISGSAMTYEVDGEQYIAAMATNALWAFKLGGTVPPEPAPPTPLTEVKWSGRIVPTDTVAVAANVSDSGLGVLETVFDEYAFSPTRARATTKTKVTWKNNGKETHTIEAQGGVWTTGPIAPGKSVSLTFDKPGTYTYICRDHPWSYGELTVEEAE